LKKLHRKRLKITNIYFTAIDSGVERLDCSRVYI